MQKGLLPESGKYTIDKSVSHFEEPNESEAPKPKTIFKSGKTTE